MADSTERTRRYRARRQAGMRIVPVEITPEIEASLVEAEWLDLKNLENAQAVGEAVGQLLSWWNKAFGCNADTPIDAVTRHATTCPAHAKGGNHDDD